MPILLVTACDGLHTQPNENGEIPPGALTLAENIVVSRDGIAECRRGFEEAVAGGEGDDILHLAPYDGTLMAHRATGIEQSNAAVTALTPLEAISNAVAPRRGASMQGRHVYLTDDGIHVWEPGRDSSESGVDTPAIPLLTPIAGGSFQATDTQVGYRVALVRKAGDSERTMMSEPSGRVTIANATGSAQDVAVTIRDYALLTAGITLQVYRTLQSEGATIDPGDEAGLVYERTTFPLAGGKTTSTMARDGAGVVTVTLTATHDFQAGDMVEGPTGVAGGFTRGDYVVLSTPSASSFTYYEGGGVIASGPVTVSFGVAGVGFIDNLPDSLVGAALYTNASQEGIGQANGRPPFVLGDVAEFRRCAFYGYTRERQAYDFRVLSIGTPNGIQSGDTITVSDGTTLSTVSAGTVETMTVIPAAFKLFTTGTVAENIANTAQSLARMLTAASDGALIAYYTSGATDVPGKITVARNDPAGAAFTVAFSRPASFITFGKTSSEATTWKNRVHYSKVDQPEAVPALNFLDVGSSDAEILRLMPLRDALIVLKEDGVFRITGDGPWNFRVDPFDLTVKCIGAQTAATLENTVVTLTDQGVARISDTGVVVLSRPIEDKILPLITSSMLSVVNSYAFGVGYDSARKYILWLPYLPASTSANLAYVYDLFTEAWTYWAIDASHAVINPADDKLYVATGNDIWRELKTFTAADLEDPSMSGSIPVFVEWAPKFGDRPDVLHQFREVGLIVGDAEWTTTGQVGFSTDLDPSMEFVTLAAGEANQVIRVSVPRTKQRGRRLNVQFRMDEAGKAVQLKGLRVVYETTGERIRR